eukprot:jgi/Mesen1/8719/ME000052S08152
MASEMPPSAEEDRLLEVQLKQKQEEARHLQLQLDEVKALAEQLKEPFLSDQVVAAFSELLDSLIADIASEAHRAATLGLDARLDDTGHGVSPAPATWQAAANHGAPAGNEPVRYTTDVFGQSHPAVASEAFECMNCGRAGRNASRLASRNMLSGNSSQQRRQRNSPIPSSLVGTAGSNGGAGPAAANRTPTRTPNLTPEGSQKSGADVELNTSEESPDDEAKDTSYDLPQKLPERRKRGTQVARKAKRSAGSIWNSNLSQSQSQGQSQPGGAPPSEQHHPAAAAAASQRPGTPPLPATASAATSIYSEAREASSAPPERTHAGLPPHHHHRRGAGAGVGTGGGADVVAEKKPRSTGRNVVARAQEGKRPRSSASARKGLDTAGKQRAAPAAGLDRMEAGPGEGAAERGSVGAEAPVLTKAGRGTPRKRRKVMVELAGLASEPVPSAQTEPGVARPQVAAAEGLSGGAGTAERGEACSTGREASARAHAGDAATPVAASKKLKRMNQLDRASKNPAFVSPRQVQNPSLSGGHVGRPPEGRLLRSSSQGEKSVPKTPESLVALPVPQLAAVGHLGKKSPVKPGQLSEKELRSRKIVPQEVHLTVSHKEKDQKVAKKRPKDNT